MRDRRDDSDKQSTHARVLEALEAAIAAHPAGSAKRPKLAAVPEPGVRRPNPAPRVYANDNVVVPFQPKVVQLVPRHTNDDPDNPTAA